MCKLSVVPEGAGDAEDAETFVLNGNLKTEGRPRYLFRDDDGKVKAYGTQLSIVRQDTDGTWVAIPTIIDGREPLSDDAAFEHYRRTGEFFHRGATEAEAKAGADAAHVMSQAQDMAWWNNYIADHLSDGTLSTTDKDMAKVVSDPGFLRWAAGQEKGAYERKPGDSDAELRIECRRRAILDGKIEPNAIDLKTLPVKDLNRARKARRNYINKRRADMGPGGLKADVGGGKAKRKIPPIVKGPIHYGPPPPSRGKYPGVANNPGNVEKHERRSDKTLFKGEIAGGVRPKRFANFSDPVDGLVAAATVLSRRAAGLAERGLPFTIENYVPGYAPSSENDVEGYINNLSKYSGFARDAVLDTGNAEDMAKLLRNVVRFESGVPNSEWFTDDEYRRAARAMNRSPESAPSLPASNNRQASGGSTQTYEETRHG